MSAHANSDHYYVPHGSHWPIVGSIGLFTTLSSAALWLEDVSFGRYLFPVGICIILFMMFGWFGTVIRESESGTYNAQVDRSFRWGMTWFIFSEVMFFAENDSSSGVTAQAIATYAPGEAAKYVHKTECFCFTQESFGPREARHMPVRFYIDPALPRDVSVVTISYTYFNITSGENTGA
jgi:hypothetical protein